MRATMTPTTPTARDVLRAERDAARALAANLSARIMRDASTMTPAEYADTLAALKDANRAADAAAAHLAWQATRARARR